MTTEAMLWQPSAERIARANITEFARRAAGIAGRPFPDYAALWRWSTEEREAFWRALWDFAGVIGERGARTLVDPAKMPGARWFPDARINFAENLIARRPIDDTGDALVFRGENKFARRVSHAELVAMVSRVATALKEHGIASGDRVAAYVPNMPEVIGATLGTASVGAVWSSCSPDFGVQGVLDRFGQIGPRVLFTVDGYWYNGKAIPILDKVAEVVARLPTVERVVVIPYLEASGQGSPDLSPIRGAVSWETFVGPGRERKMTPQVSTISWAVAKTAPCWTSFSPAAGLRSLMYSVQVSTSRLAMADPIAPTPMNPTRSVMSLALSVVLVVVMLAG